MNLVTKIAAFNLLFFIFLSAQPPVRQFGSNINGKIFDSSTNKPLEFANVVLFNAQDSSQVSGTVTNKDGFFEIQRVRPGKYYIVLSFIGFKNHLIDNVNVEPQKTLELEQISLDLVSYSTDEVTVKGEKASVSYEIDKKVIKVSDLISAASGSAVDVLENVPSVTVDIDGNVSLRGSSNFTVLIDGRPSVLDASDALQQIPASSIENIEIVTNPSAKYNPEGTSGIINVVMKKNSNLGFSGSFETNTGINDKYGVEGLLDFKGNGYGFNIGADYNKRNFDMDIANKRETYFLGNTKILNSLGEGSRGRTSYGLRASLNLDLSENDNITFGGRYGSFSFGGGMETKYNELSNTIETSYTNISDDNRESNFYSAFSSFIHKFNKNGHQLTADFNYSYRDGDDKNISERFDESNILYDGRISEEAGPSYDTRLKADYTLPFSENSKLEAGYQSQFSTSEEKNRYYEYNTSISDYEFQKRYSNSTKYIRNVHSLYSTYSNSIGKLQFQLGLRAELTDNDISLIDTTASYKFHKWDYFPGLHTSWKLDNGNQIMASYTRRINRPRGMMLEPFRTWTDSYNMREGNPELEPEYIDSYELGYQLLLGKTVISTEAYYRVNNSKIEMVRYLYSSDVTLNTFENVGKDYSLGTELMFNVDPAAFWNVNLIGNLYNYKVTGTLYDQNFEKENFTWNLRFNNMFKITASTSLQLNGMYNSKRVSAQGENKGFFTINAALRQSFLDNKFIATLQVRDFLGSMNQESFTRTADYYNYSKFTREAPSVMLNLKYIFNNFKQERNRNENNNEDMEDDEMMF
ncbi:MAG: TonB-dependent receptor [Ignavibacteria bacterium]|nr:TonB-dependent receptor [Ignavibacteria bacterium]